MAYNFPSSPAIGQVFADVASGVTYEWNGYGWKIKSTPGSPAPTAALGGQIGQCRLVKPPGYSNIVLQPYDGNAILINGVWQNIPSAGVELAPPAGSNYAYYIYAFMSGATMMLEASATGYVTTLSGIKVKSGDSTRVLVGMARNVSGVWVNTPTKRLVISHFNRRPIGAENALIGTIYTSAGPWSELDPSARYEILNWADDVVFMSVQGAVSTSLPSYSYIASGEGASPYVRNFGHTADNQDQGFSASGPKILAEGWHEMRLLGGNGNTVEAGYLSGYTGHSAIIMG